MNETLTKLKQTKYTLLKTLKKEFKEVSLKQI